LFASLPCWGDEEVPVRQWILAWQRTKDLIDWTQHGDSSFEMVEQIRCFKSKLRGRAWDWMVDQPPSTTDMWTIEDWEEALVATFSVSYHPTTAVMEFHLRKQLNESVSEYAFSLLRLAYKTGQTDRQELADALVAGLREDIAKKLKEQGEKPSFEEAFGRACTWEAKLKCLERVGAPSIGTPSAGTPNDTSMRKCYTCGGFGHYHRECPKSPIAKK
jgi:Retrotransposon gag protein/Zinc knuckle